MEYLTGRSSQDMIIALNSRVVVVTYKKSENFTIFLKIFWKGKVHNFEGVFSYIQKGGTLLVEGIRNH